MIKCLTNIVIIFCFSLSENFTQKTDSLIQLYPGMGDTVSYVDRTYFGIYSQIDGFEKAVVYIRNNEELISEIYYTEEGVLKDTLLINDLSILESTRDKIEGTIVEYNQKFKEPVDVEVRTFIGGKYEGSLEAFSKDYIFLRSDKNIFTGDEGKFNYKIENSAIEEIIIKGESDFLTPILWGSGIGVAFGILGLIGLAGASAEATGSEDPDLSISSEDVPELIGFALGFALFGAAIGAGIGWLNAEDDESIQFKTNQSVIKLKEYARYHLIHEKKIDADYEEIIE